MSVLAADASHAPALLELAAIYKGKGLLPEARDALARAAAAAPPGDGRAAEGLATVLTDLGTAAKVAGRLDEAVRLYKEALEAWPKLAAAHYNLVGRCGRLISTAAGHLVTDRAWAWRAAGLGLLVLLALGVARAAGPVGPGQSVC